MIAAAPKNERPGTAATVAEPVSNPTGEQEMNKAVNTTQAGRPATLADLFEEPIDGANRMASILARLLERALGKDLAQYRRPDCYHLTRDQVEDIMFSIYQTQDFIKQIQTALEEAVQ